MVPQWVSYFASAGMILVEFRSESNVDSYPVNAEWTPPMKHAGEFLASDVRQNWIDKHVQQSR